jgi:hypothetical protein
MRSILECVRAPHRFRIGRSAAKPAVQSTVLENRAMFSFLQKNPKAFEETLREQGLCGAQKHNSGKLP